MRGVVMYTAGDVRVEERSDPKIVAPTDAIVRLTATLPLDQAADGYKAMHERRSIKTLLLP